MSAQTPFPDSSSDWSYGAPPPQQFGAPPLASWGRRACAALIDILLFVLLVGVPAVAIYFVLLVTMDEEDADALFDLVWLVLSLGFGLTYFPLTMSRKANNGQTIGKQAVGIRVVKESGERFSGGAAIVRELLVKYILLWICFIVGILDIFSPLWDDNSQAWHDKIVHTLVVRA